MAPSVEIGRTERIMTFEDGALIGLWGILIAALVGILTRWLSPRRDAEAPPDLDDLDFLLGPVIEGEVL